MACALFLVACAASSSPRAGAPTATAPDLSPPKRSSQPYGLSGGSYGPEPTAPPTALEREALESVRKARPGGAEQLRPSAALTLSARELARQAARSTDLAKGGSGLRAALAAGYSFDPAPTVLLLRSRSSELPAALARAVTIGRATRIGIGIVEQGQSAHAAVLLANRTASLHPFPRDVAKGTRTLLRGELLGLGAPRVFVTLPSGQAIETGRARGRTFEATISFEQPGRYLIEVIGSAPSGPEVAALLAVSCDGASLEVPIEPSREPDSATAAEAQVFAALQATRARHQLPPLELSPSVSVLARQHSERMRKAGLLAHVLPGSGDAGERLRAAKIPYRRVLENVALADTSLAAHQTVEESPAHLRNVLDPQVTEVGLGVDRGTLPSGSSGSYLTEIFVEPLPPEPTGRLTPEALVREAIWRERARLGRPSLLSDPRLDQLAQEAARAMLRQGHPSGNALGNQALALNRKVSATDVFVAASPDEAAHSPNLGDAQFKRVGVGVVQGDSPKYGAGRLWIAVVYTD